MAAVVLGAPSSAAADDDVVAAAKAFSRAQSAELRDAPGQAAELYELADRLAPSPEALRSAARMRFEAGDAAVAATHASALLSRYPGDDASEALARRILEELRPKLGRVLVSCEAPCNVMVDGAAAGIETSREHEVYLSPGEHEVLARFGDGRRSSEVVTIRAGGEASMRLSLPERAEPTEEPEPSEPQPVRIMAPRSTPTPTDEPEDDDGIGRGWVFTSAALTVGLGGAAVWSGMDVLQRHDDYEANPSIEGYEDGLRRERRTNILLGATALAGVSTVILGVMTDWSSDDGDEESRTRGMAVVPVTGGASLSLRGRF